MKNFEIRNAISNLRLWTNKLTVVTGKWYKIKKENRLCDFRNLNAIEDEFHFLIHRSNHKKMIEYTLKSIQDTEHIDLIRRNITKKLSELFSNGSLRSLYVLGKFVQTPMESRENSQTEAFINITSRKKISQFLLILVYIYFLFMCFELLQIISF